ncbi:MAG: RNA polymerase sigma-70 factor [Tunicatimonas sp.]
MQPRRDDSDAALVRRIQQGDERAFQEMFYAYKDRLFSYCYRFTKSEELAEEIIHDALLKVWNDRHRLDLEKPLAGYLYTITRNLSLNFLKKMAAEEALKQRVRYETPQFHNDTEEAINYTNLKQLVKVAICQLPTQQQRVYRMSRDQHLTHEEIGQRLGISPNTVKNHVIRALQTIKAHLRVHTDISFFVGYLVINALF